MLNNKASCNKRFISKIRSEISRIDIRCVIAGAVITLLMGFVSTLISRSPGFRLMFKMLEKPPATPPSFVFPIVWTVLYILIGGAAGAVACSCEKAMYGEKWRGLLFYIIMLVFNFIWSPLFFGMGAFFAAFLAILIMILTTIITISAFSRIYFVSAAAMTLYLVWLIFAAYLNFGIIILN